MNLSNLCGLFTLDEKQQEKLIKWMADLPPQPPGGAIGGGTTYSFTPTSIGIVIKVEVLTVAGVKEIDLTDYDGW